MRSCRRAMMDVPVIIMVQLWLVAATLVSGTSFLRPLPQLFPLECEYRIHLTVVSCVGKGLTRLPKGLPNTTRTLVLNDNLFTRLDANTGFHELKELQKLYIINNKISFVGKNTFPTSLTQLSLAGNRLTEVTSKMFGYLPLPFLHLQNNRIERVGPRSFSPLLRFLNLDSNRLKRIKRVAFETCVQVQILQLTNNSIQHIEPLAIPRNTRLLRLGYNNLSRIGQEFAHLTKLKTLYLYFNDIRTIGVDSFSELRVIDSINLMGNKLTEVLPFQFANQVKLTNLQLYRNRITSFPQNALPAGHVPPLLYLQGNPLHCNCEMFWFIDLQKRGKVNVLLFDDSFFDTLIKSKDWPDIPHKDDVFCQTPRMFKYYSVVNDPVDLRFCPYMSLHEYKKCTRRMNNGYTPRHCKVLCSPTYSIPECRAPKRSTTPPHAITTTAMTTGVVASTTPTEMNARLVTSGGLSAGECYNAGLILTAAILCSLVCGGLA